MNGYLLDENLPRRLTFVPSLPVLHSVAALGEGASDAAVWEHARTNALAIVSRDADFSARVMLATPPPWIVHLRGGNMRLAVLHAWLAAAWPHVERLLPAHKLVSVYADRIESVRE